MFNSLVSSRPLFSIIFCCLTAASIASAPGARAQSALGAAVSCSGVDICLTATRHGFGAVAEGASEQFAIQLTNEDATAFPFSISLAGSAAFTQQNSCGVSVAPAARCEIVFTYAAPADAESNSATFTIAANSKTFSPANTGKLYGHSVPIAPGGTVTLNSGNHDFGGVAVGSSAAFGLSITNDSNQTVPLTLTPGNDTPGVNYAGILLYGDSNMCGFGATTYKGDPTTPTSMGAPTGIAAIMAPDFHGTPYNYCKTGDMAGDWSTNKAYLAPVSNNQQAPSFVAFGTNEAAFCDGGVASAGCLANFQAAMTAGTVLRAVPTPNFVSAQSMAKVGNWATTTIFGGGYAAYTNSANATARAAITSYGGPLYVLYAAANSAGGAFAVTVDGTSSPCTTIVSAGFNGQSVTTNNGTSVVVFAASCTIPAGSHTVLFTHDSSTRNAEIVGITTPSANPGYLPTDVNQPQVYLSEVLPQYKYAHASVVAAYTNVIQNTLVPALQAQGLNVVYVPVSSYISANSPADMNCGINNYALHLCDGGFVQWKTAIEATMQPEVKPPYSSATNCPTTLASGAACEVVITYTPSAVGAASNYAFTLGTGNSGVAIQPAAKVTFSGYGAASQ